VAAHRLELDVSVMELLATLIRVFQDKVHTIRSGA
jgi:hypothetical protein